MEQIKVNMIPNNEVKTIHCSKGDGNTRKWGFQLYKDDGAIDASSISPQMFYDSYKGGTEQVLPENTFVPTTSPIIADIQYKDALRSEQEFLYRESPATVDGKAKITKIKGNTLVWNQMIENGDFAENSGWTKSSNSTLSIANNKATVSATNDTLCYIRYQLAFQVYANHKYLLSFYLTSPVATTKTTARFFRQGVINNYFENQALSANTRTRYMSVITATVDCPNTLLYFYVNNDGVALTGDSIFEDAMLVDLTLLNSSAITDATSFRSYYNLPYYAYTTGKLLPFMGESLKTMGKNLLQIPTPTQTINGVTLTVENGTVIANGTATADITYVINISGFIEGNYYFSGCADGGSNTKYDVFMWDATTASRPKQWDRTTNAISLFDSSSQGKVYIIPSHSTSLRIRIRSGVVANNLTFKLMIRFGNVQDSTFEPYISSTINLSVLEHFPTGMKDCSQSSQVFDEKTESEAITRVGSADLGTIDWTYYTGGAEPVFYGAPDDLVRGVSGEIGNIKCPLYNVIASRTRGQFAAQASDLDFQITADARTVMIKNLAYTSKEAFASAMSGIYLYYQLGTPIETAIQTASLVSENTEIPLYEDNDILVGECDELLSAESGFVPVKIKYQDDETVYSQKIQLHVEK